MQWDPTFWATDLKLCGKSEHALLVEFRSQNGELLGSGLSGWKCFKRRIQNFLRMPPVSFRMLFIRKSQLLLFIPNNSLGIIPYAFHSKITTLTFHSWLFIPITFHSLLFIQNNSLSIIPYAIVSKITITFHSLCFSFENHKLHSVCYSFEITILNFQLHFLRAITEKMRNLANNLRKYLANNLRKYWDVLRKISEKHSRKYH